MRGEESIPGREDRVKTDLYADLLDYRHGLFSKLLSEVPLRRFLPVSRWARVALAGVLPPGVSTLLALVPYGISTATAALGYVLAVVAAAATGGLPAGLTASLLSFLALNFFFTEPFHTFRVNKVEDLLALGAFVLVSLIVGTLLSTALSERARAERREREARLQQGLGARLLAGEATEVVLSSFARSAVELFGLLACEVITEFGAARVGALEGSDDNRAVSSEKFTMVARGREVGQILAVPGLSRPRLGPEERHVIQGLANQLALALDGIRLASEAHQARLEGEKDRLRAALFSSVTHDLKTPLASIKASVTGLLDLGVKFSPADHRELLDTISQEEERLSRLIGNLLYLSRIRAGAVAPEKSPSDLQDLIEAVVGRSVRDHPFRLAFAEDLSAVPIDVVQIDQALTNILENAAKFAPIGSPITLEAAQGQDMVEVRVEDRGPGIPPQDRERVFEPFVRGEGHPNAGTGLGLSIARAIVEAHGGNILIEDTPGGGATVLFTLPIRE
jgi:two-component system, OmpR family, sensor histidine kinase KdpD